jgi:hypothetical protein
MTTTTLLVAALVLLIVVGVLRWIGQALALVLRLVLLAALVALLAVFAWRGGLLPSGGPGAPSSQPVPVSPGGPR